MNNMSSPIKQIKKQVKKLFSSMVDIPEKETIIIREKAITPSVATSKTHTSLLSPSVKYNDPPIHRPADMNAAMRRRWKSEGLPSFPQGGTSSYTVYKDGITYYALNGTTGKVDFSAPDIIVLMINVVASLGTSGGEIRFKKGAYAFTSDTDGITLNTTSNISLIGETGTIFALSGSTTNAVRLNGVITNLRILGITFTGTYTYGIYGYNTTSFGDVVIEDCIFKDGTVDTVIYMQDKTATVTDVESITVRGNLFENMVITGLLMYLGCISANITDNEFRRVMVNRGVQTHLRNRNIRITDNSFLDMAAYGENDNIINVGYETENCVVTDNTFVWSTALTSGDVLDGCIVAAYSTIDVNTPAHLVVTGNTVKGVLTSTKGPKTGIYLHGSPSGSGAMRGVVCNGNTITGTTTDGGIECVNLQDSVVTNNVIREVGAQGMQFNGSRCDNTIVANNVIVNPNMNAGSGYFGILLHNEATGLHIHHNIITTRSGDMQTAIYENTGSDNNVIEWNSIGVCTSGAIVKVGAATVVRYNRGYFTDNEGTVTMISGNNAVTVNLSGSMVNISGSPTGVVLTPMNTISGKAYFVASTNSGSFTINTVTSSPESITFAYKAFYNP